MKNQNDNFNKKLQQMDAAEIIKCFSLDLIELVESSKKSDTVEQILANFLIHREEQGLINQNKSIEDWRNEQFGERIDEYFLSKKRDLDTVTFWFYLLESKTIAMEIYYQLCNKETNFEELAKENQSIKCYKNKPVGRLSGFLASKLSSAIIGVPTLPTRTDDGFLILQVIKKTDATLDSNLRKRLLVDIEKDWCRRSLKQILDDYLYDKDLDLS